MMNSSLIRTSIGLVLILGIRGSWHARAQDPPPAPPTASSPEELLKAQHLKRAGSTWILDSESTVLKDLRDARYVYRQLEQSMMRRQQLEYDLQGRQGMMMQLRAQSDTLSQQIAQFDQHLENLVVPPSGNNFVEAQRAEVARQRNELVRQNNLLVNQLNNFQEQARQQSQDQDPRLQLNAEIAECREKYMGALLDFRKSADQVKAKYDELAKNKDVATALDALSQRFKTKQKLGPSKALQDAIKLLERSEGTVKSESIPLHKESGVDHVYATMGKTPVKMVFDTGAGLTTISANLATRVGVKLKSGESGIQLRTADGTLVDGKIGIIPSVRVGKFTIANVECAIMPAEKGEIDPLLGQSFLKNFQVEYHPEASKLTLKRVETGATPADSADAFADPEAPRATAKSKRAVRQPRSSARSKRAPRSQAAETPDEPVPAGDDGSETP